MAEKALGQPIQIHGGGIDLAFPHHENEIAQSEACSDVPFADIWMHNEMLELSGDKMSKSEGNIALLGDVLDRWPREVVIAYFLTSHYRSRLPFGDERLGQAQAAVERLTNALRALDRAAEGAGDGYDTELAAAVVTGRQHFFAALDDDFNTPEAFAALFEMVTAVNRRLEAGEAGADQIREARRELVELLDVFGIASIDHVGGPAVPSEVMELLMQREEARAARDFEKADALRDAIAERGFDLMDTAEGPQVYPR
jgi:cysteinyl-tRNA synthetase